MYENRQVMLLFYFTEHEDIWSVMFIQKDGLVSIVKKKQIFVHNYPMIIYVQQSSLSLVQ